MFNIVSYRYHGELWYAAICSWICTSAVRIVIQKCIVQSIRSMGNKRPGRKLKKTFFAGSVISSLALNERKCKGFDSVNHKL